jgi:hypothetical protein
MITSRTLPAIFALLSLTLSYTVSGSAQNQRAANVSPSAKTITQDSFTSLDGRFRIALPAEISGLGSPSIETPAGRVTGTMFRWRVEHGMYTVTFFDHPEQLEANSKSVFDKMHAPMRENLKVADTDGKLGERDLKVTGHPGRELRFDTSKALIVVRHYLEGRRMYQVTASVVRDIQPNETGTANALRKQEVDVLKILDSFELIAPAEVAEVRAKETLQATPDPLPQTPIVARPKSDAQDEGLTGKIKTVVTETEDRSGTWQVQGRKPASIEHFNKQGNLVKRESYDYRGNLSDIAVYGYLDGQRAMKSESIEREYNPPPMRIAPPAGQSPQKYDQRYSYKFTHKYDDGGRLTEKIWYGNSGDLWLRYVYKYRESEVEELVYSANGSLNQRYVSTLDNRGNEVEQTNYNVAGNSVRSRVKYSYEFDAQGNWTKRTSQRQDVAKGEDDYKPGYITHRTITYN